MISSNYFGGVGDYWDTYGWQTLRLENNTYFDGAVFERDDDDSSRVLFMGVFWTESTSTTWSKRLEIAPNSYNFEAIYQPLIERLFVRVQHPTNEKIHIFKYRIDRD